MRYQIEPVNPEGDPSGSKSLDFQLYKSLTYLPHLEFIEQDSEGMKMRVLISGDFPYQVGYTEISNYDDRKFLVTKVDPEHRFLWFGLWDD